jgi:hypothetical protein
MLSQVVFHAFDGFLGLVWESKYQRRLDVLKSLPYSKLYKERILAHPIPSGFVAPNTIFPRDFYFPKEK